MKLSFQAMKRYIDFQGSPVELGQVLASLGFPNDGITYRGQGLDQVLVGKIISKEKHPQADRLSLLKVSIGTEDLPIVCGASNMKEGDLVALAPAGAKIPGKDGSGLVMKETKIRGETSRGMCCSLAELGLGAEADGIWILPPDRVGSDALGKPVSQFFSFQDAILEIDVTPNRPDCLSVRGLAREAGARLSLKLKNQQIYKWKSPSSAVAPNIENLKETSGFAACLVSGVTLKESPEWVKLFLESSGARPLNNLVDVTNLVLFEFGHPIHFFDADTIDLKSITSRRAKKGERLELLNGKTVELSEDDLVIADQSGPLSLAGVMGGLKSSVTERTKNILIEAACFDPKRIRETAKRHQLSSESSYRFERGLTAFRLDEVIERALALLKEVSGFESAQGSKVFDKSKEIPSVLWDRAKVEGKLGKLTLNDNQIFELLRRLEYEFEPKGSANRVMFPWYRLDGECLEDVMEDIARLIGYDQLESRELVSVESKHSYNEAAADQKLANVLVERFISLGFSESLHMSFANSNLENYFFKERAVAPVTLQNPLHSEKSTLRRSLLPQLIQTAQMNASYGEDDIRLVEAGTVFRSDCRSRFKDSPASEVLSVACVWLVRPQDKKILWKSSADSFFEFKGWLQNVFSNIKLAPQKTECGFLHPKRLFEIGGVHAGELHPALKKTFDIQGECYLAEWTMLGKLESWKFQMSSELPAVDLDLSLVVSHQLSAENLLTAIRKQAHSWVETIKLYDVFESDALGKGKKSFTFALRYRDLAKTLTMEEARAAHDKLVKAVVGQFAPGDVALR